MIIGNGDIAKALKEGGVDREDTIFFASGVSNSQETRSEEFRREIDLLLKHQSDFKKLIYFSSLSVFYADTRYTQHKKQMESAVKNFPRYTIIRLGNISWGDNPHTFINYFRNRMIEGIMPEVKDEYRYIIDKDEFIDWIKMIPTWNCEMNLPGKRMKVQEAIDQYGHIGIHSK